MDQCEESQTFEYHFVTSRGNQHYALVKLAPIGYVGRFSGVRLVIVKIHAYLNLLRMPDKYFYTRYQISGREKEVLAYLLKGFKNKEIGEQLFISEITVKKHVSSILQKTYSRNRDELVTLIKNERTSQPAGQGEMPFSFAARS